jgi:hypothetical protein
MEELSPIVRQDGSGRPAKPAFRNPFKIMFRVSQLANKARRGAAAKALQAHEQAGSAKTRHQGDLEAHYTDAMLKKRKVLRNDEGVEEELEKFWKSAHRHHNQKDATHLDREDYRGLHGRMVKALHEVEGGSEIILSAEETQQAFEEDWRADSHSDGGDTGFVDQAKIKGE